MSNLVESNALTVEDFEAALPKQYKGTLSPEIMDNINKVFSDEQFREEYRQNLIGYTHILKEGKFKISSYIDAVRYVGFKAMGMTNQEAYSKTFPKKFTKLLEEGRSAKTISAYVSQYHKSKLVTLLSEQTMIPVAVLGQDIFWDAVNKNAKLMDDPMASKHVQQRAATDLMTILKPPETTKIELNAKVSEDGTIGDLKQTMAQLAKQQQELIEAGLTTAAETAESKIIEGEIEEAEIIEEEEDEVVDEYYDPEEDTDRDIFK